MITGLVPFGFISSLLLVSARTYISFKLVKATSFPTKGSSSILVVKQRRLSSVTTLMGDQKVVEIA